MPTHACEPCMGPRFLANCTRKPGAPVVPNARRCVRREGVAVRNPDFKEGGDPKARDGQPIIITKPGRIFSFDETRIEMDMTKGSKAKQERTIVDRTQPREERCETLAFKGGLTGTGVGGSTAAGDALPALFIIAGGGLTPAMCTPSPNCDFYRADGGCCRLSSPPTKRAA